MKNKNGITLIVLVITIIVMLILVTVTIAIAFGNNGIVFKAREATSLQQKEQEKETLLNAVIGLYDFSEKEITRDNLVTALDGWTVSEGDAPWICTSPKGNEFKVLKTGTIEEILEEKTNEEEQNEKETNEAVAGATFSGYYDKTEEQESQSGPVPSAGPPTEPPPFPPAPDPEQEPAPYQSISSPSGQLIRTENPITLTWAELCAQTDGSCVVNHGWMSSTSVGFGAFYNSEALLSITLPDDLTLVGYVAFYGCCNLASVTYKGKKYTSESELTSALNDNGVFLGELVFSGSGLQD